MLVRNTRALLLIPFIGLAIGACSQQSDEPAATSADDTAVHTAEVAAAEVSIEEA